MRNRIKGELLFIGAFALLLSAFVASPAQAITGWSAGRIIDDSVFTAYTSMSAAQIQSFLASKVPTCDTYGKQLSEFGGPDLNGDGKVQRWEWGKAKYNQTTFPCLKDYVQNSKKASQIIYEKAHKYRISPRVLIVLLQKEQGLVTDTWPLNIQYRSATGYGCPDTAPCDSQYYGLTNQLDWAAKMFRAIMDNSPSWYTPYELGNNYIQYNPNASCGGSTVNIQNRATQALYNYTPYQPNKAALDAGWGSAHCGAYGNRNFFLYFSGWFGRPNAAATYGYSLVSREIFSDAGYTTKVGSNSANIEPGDLLYVKVVVKNTGNQVWYNDFLRMGTVNPNNRISPFRDSTWLSGARPARMTEGSVAAGGNATFTFKVKAPSTFGIQQESYGVLLEGQRWLSGTISFSFNVTSPDPVYAATSPGFTLYKDPAHTQKISPSGLTLYQGSKVYINLKVKNTGNRDFPASITKIATSNPHDRASLFSHSGWLAAPSRVATAAEGMTAPNNVGTYRFSLEAPSDQTGALTEQLGLVIEGQRWVSDNVFSLPINVLERPPSDLSKSESIMKGKLLLSPNERFSLKLQGDGNLVLYAGSKALWSTRTVGGGYRLTMQNDGNLVLYSSTGKALWHTRTAGKDGNQLIMQNDGNLVLYSSTGKALWHTRTSGAS